ncbi:MAG: hypothetical protein WCP52_08050 [Bacteroidota bacterium]
MNSEFLLFSNLAQSEILMFEYYTVFLRKDNIIQIQVKDNFECELEDSQNMLNCIQQLSDGRKYPLLVIYSDFNSFSDEAKALVAKHTLTSADALVGKGTAFKIVGNFYLRISTPVRPTRLFTDVESALIWLEKYKNPMLLS